MCLINSLTILLPTPLLSGAQEKIKIKRTTTFLNGKSVALQIPNLSSALSE